VWDRVVGVLSRRRTIRALSELGGEAIVLDVMDREVRVAAPGDDLGGVLRLLRSRPASPVLVMADDKLAGMITLERLTEFIELSAHRPTSGDDRA
jgi:CBS domain-containing protein